MKKELIKSLCEKYEFWKELKQEEQDRFLKETVIEEYEKNQIVYNPGKKCKGMIKVIKGTLKVFMISEEGREITLYKIREGEVCTLSSSCIMEEIAFDIYIKAGERTEILVTNAVCLKSIMNKNLNLENYIYKQAASKFTEIMWTIEELLFTSVDKRLALFLLKEETNNIVELTHEEISVELGTAREVISRILKKFEKEELIKTFRGKIEIKDKNKLKDKI